MLVFETPKSLVELGFGSLYNIVFTVLSKGVSMTERTDEAVQMVGVQMEEDFVKGKYTKPDRLEAASSTSSHSDKAALDLLSVKQMLETHGGYSVTFLRYFEGLPSEFANELLLRVLKDLFKVACYEESEIDSENSEIDSENSEMITVWGVIMEPEPDIHKFVKDRWSFPARIRVAFRLLLRCLLSKKTHTIDISDLTNKYFSIFAAFIRQTAIPEDFMISMKAKNRTVFIHALMASQNDFSSLTSISMQHLADGELLWCICCHCPNLWHLDLSGEMFDLQRYIVNKESEGFVSAFTKDESGVKRRQYEEADFLDSLCGLYGNSGNPHAMFEGKAVGCYKLRTLLLPSYGWEDSEEETLIEIMIKIFHQLPYLEEVTGVCLFRVLCKLNESKHSCPMMLKLKKFDGKTGGHELVGIDPKRLLKVKLPLVEEVVFNANVLMPPSTLEQLFPNMKHLTLTPYDSRAYSFYSIVPYLKNLVSLDIEFYQGVSLSNMCDLARQCCLLKDLSVTCPALLTETQSANNVQSNVKETKKKVWPPPYRVDKQEKKVYEPAEYDDNKYNVFYYERKMENVWMTGTYIRDNSSMPAFSKLQKLQFFNMTQFDGYALFQCVRGSPMLQTFTVVLDKMEPGYKDEFDDYYIGKLAPFLRRVREVTIAALCKKLEGYLYLTGAAVAHLLYFCPDIRSIGRLEDWNMSVVETEGLNYYFAGKNYVVRVH